MSNNQLFENIPEDCIFDIPHKNKIISAKVIKVCDGDTLSVIFELRNGVYMNTKIRILGVDTPETHSDNELEKLAGECVTKYVKKLVEGKILKITIKNHDKYGGRFVGDVYLSNASKPRRSSLVSFNLIKNKYGREYNGEKKEAWTEEELQYIIKI